MRIHILICCFSWPQPYRQLLRYIADRTGILSFANLPLLWLFAGRNNIFLWATGWSFARFNIFHRHVAWIATIQAVIHTVAYCVLFTLGKFASPTLFRKTLNILIVGRLSRTVL